MSEHLSEIQFSIVGFGLHERNAHHSRRAPRKSWGFSWGRYPSARGGLPATHVEWRLFRRDHTGRLHFAYRSFPADTPRDHIAGVLLAARRQLREVVDDIDLAALMQEAA